MHTLTRESQEVIRTLFLISLFLFFTKKDSVIASTPILHCGQLNITTSTLSNVVGPDQRYTDEIAADAVGCVLFSVRSSLAHSLRLLSSVSAGISPSKRTLLLGVEHR